jgi:hypothetical protein
MWNLAIPFNRLFAGILSYFWMFQLLLTIQKTTIQHTLSLLLEYKEFFLPIVFILILLSYPIGAVIQHLSYQFADKFLYKFFVFRKKNYDKDEHKRQLRHINVHCSNRIYSSLVLKEQELSILGTCSIHFLLISFTIFLRCKLNLPLVFTFIGMVIFSIMVIRKYMSYITYVKRMYKYLEPTN